MNRLSLRESKRAIIPVSIAAGALMLAGCAANKGYKNGDSLARCTPTEVAAGQPLNIAPYNLADPYNIPLLRKIIKIHPQVLLDTAKRIHPDPNHSGNSLLHNLKDLAHNSDSGGSSADILDNTGDMLCRTTPFGDPNSKERRVYFDRDGLGLLQAVEQALGHLAQDPTIYS